MPLRRAVAVAVTVCAIGCGGRIDVGSADAAAGIGPDGGPADAEAAGDAGRVLDWCDVTRGLVDGCDDAGTVTGSTPRLSAIYCPEPSQCLYDHYNEGIHAWGCCHRDGVCEYGDPRYSGCAAIQR